MRERLFNKTHATATPPLNRPDRPAGLWGCLALAFLILAQVQGMARDEGSRAFGSGSPQRPPLVWDAELKEVTTKPGDAQAHFQFWFTNASASVIQIHSARSSCFCTVARLPVEPWPILPGSNGCIEVTMDLAGKRGTLSKPVNVTTSAGTSSLTVRTHITPEAVAEGAGSMNDEERLRNLQLAAQDRQVVFKKQECAQCHAVPARGKVNGAQLYAGVCAVCHDSVHRAATVPDLAQVSRGRDAEYWRGWIAHGRPGSVMPAFAESEGGPLSEVQIDALVRHLVTAFPPKVQPGGSGGSVQPARVAAELKDLPLSESISVFPLSAPR